MALAQPACVAVVIENSQHAGRATPRECSRAADRNLLIVLYSLGRGCLSLGRSALTRPTGLTPLLLGSRDLEQPGHTSQQRLHGGGFGSLQVSDESQRSMALAKGMAGCGAGVGAAA